MNGTSTGTASKTVDHRRNAREQPDDRLEYPLPTTSGANSTMNTAMNSEETNAIATAPIVITDRAPDQRPGVKGVNEAPP